MTSRRDFFRLLRWPGVFCLSQWLPGCSGTDQQAPSTAVFYGRQIPDQLWTRYQRVIVEAEALEGDRVLLEGRAEPFLYVSVGEAEPWRPGYDALDRGWFLGRNLGWNSDIVDLTSAGWRRNLLEDRVAPLWARGYRGFFLDTLDSFRALSLTSAQLVDQERGLRETVAALYRRFPRIRLIFNRGFDLLPDFGRSAVGLVAESLFSGWNAERKQYFRVQSEDRIWLLNRLILARSQYGLPVTVIDYVPPDDRSAAIETAQAIFKLGFDPWVTNPMLDTVGIGKPDLVGI